MDYAGTRYLISGLVPIVVSSETGEWSVDLDVGLANTVVDKLALGYLKLMDKLGLSVTMIECERVPAHLYKRKCN